MEDAAIYKVDLKGDVIGRFGSARKLPKEFNLVNSIDCRNENELLVGELATWRSAEDHVESGQIGSVPRSSQGGVRGKPIRGFGVN